MRKDDYSVGVEAGGLYSLGQIKLLAAHIIANVGRPLERQLLVDSMVTGGLANYFDASDGVDRLVSDGAAITNADGKLELTDDGRLVVDQLSFTLPVFTREKALRTTMSLMALTRDNADNSVEIEQTDNGVYVTCQINDGPLTLLSVKLLVPDMSSASTVHRLFLENPLKVFSGTLALMTGDYNAVRKQFEAE